MRTCSRINKVFSLVLVLVFVLGASPTVNAKASIASTAPNPPVLVRPADHATGVATPPTLEVTVSDSDSPQVNVSFYGRKKAPLSEKFTIVMLPDTQNYSQFYPATFTAQTQWIADNKDALNIVYVAHVGDLVNTSTDTVQWSNASDAMELLDNASIPYGVVTGNHDEDDIYGAGSYNDTFGVSRFSGKSSFGGEYPTGDMQNSFMLFSASGMDFIVINLDDLNRDAGALDWADALLKTYSTRRGIVVSHDILYLHDGFSATGATINNALKDNPNLFLMLSGHYHNGEGVGEFHLSETYSANGGYTIHNVMANYQGMENGGQGYLRILEFDPATDQIHIKTFSPVLNAYRTGAESQFDLSYPMDSETPFSLIKTVNNVANGTNASTTWANLSAGVEYEWYAKVADESQSTTGPNWSFTTSAATCYKLSISHTGQGSDPVATPSKSNGCEYGYYVTGASIKLTAYPAIRWHVGSWTGTNNNSSTSSTNTVTMPASTLSVAVNYIQNVPAEYILTTTAVGSGTVTRNPNKTTYLAGDAVQLTATPSSGWVFAGWKGDLPEYDFVFGEEASDDISLVSLDPQGTTHVLRDVVDDSTADFARKNFTISSNSLRYKLSFDLNDLSIPNFTDRLSIFSITNNNSYSPILEQSEVVLRNCELHGLELMVVIHVDGQTETTSDWHPITFAPHTLEVETVRASDAGHNNGHVTIWLDNVSLEVKENLANYNVFGTIDGLQVGAAREGTATTGTIFYDDIVLQDGETEKFRLTHETGGVSGLTNPTSITMNSDRKVTASFIQNPTCYALTITHTGTGTDPVAVPVKSPGCTADGQYIPGELIQLTAAPAAGWQITAWTGTHNNSSTAAINKVTMPFKAATATVTYADLTTPETNLTGQPTNPTNSPNASFTFTSNEVSATFECKLNAGAFETCTSPKAYTGLADGSHTFQVRAKDATNADATPATYTWVIDTAAPETSLTNNPPAESNSPSASFTFSSNESNVTFECKLDAGAFAACTSPKDYTGLADGSHTFQVKAKDAAGNSDPTPASYTWTIETTLPNTAITTKPADPSNSTSPTFEFTSTKPNSTFECKLDAGAFETCTSPKAYTGLADGSHTFQVRAKDAVGNIDSSPASYTWVIDTVAPDTTLDGTPPAQATVANATFTFSSNESNATFECKLDDGAFEACTSPKEYKGLLDGNHKVEVRAKDAAGNLDASPASHTWAIETTVPETTITKQPKDPSNSTSASFEFASTKLNSTFECKLDDGAFEACTSPKSFVDISEGSHTFQVRATDAVGNIDPSPAVVTWAIDTVAPDTHLAAPQSNVSDSPDASFTFTSEDPEVTFECQLDDGAFEACTSPKEYSGLGDGLHTFKVRAIDSAGNPDPTPASFEWTIKLKVQFKVTIPLIYM